MTKLIVPRNALRSMHKALRTIRDAEKKLKMHLNRFYPVEDMPGILMRMSDGKIKATKEMIVRLRNAEVLE